MTKACDSVRPRIKGDGATSISPVRAVWRIDRPATCRERVRKSASGKDPPCRANHPAGNPSVSPASTGGPDRMMRSTRAAHPGVDAEGNRKIGLAGPAGPVRRRAPFSRQRFDIRGLAGRARRDAALTGPERGVFAPKAQTSCRRARPRRSRMAASTAGRSTSCPPLQALVQLRQGEMGRLRR